MAWKIDGDRLSLEPAVALAASRAVKLGGTAGEIEYAGKGDESHCIGVTDYAATSTAEATSVRLRNRGGVAEVTASAGIDAHAKVSLASDGRVATTTAAGPIFGVALEAASGDGSIIPVLLMAGTDDST